MECSCSAWKPEEYSLATLSLLGFLVYVMCFRGRRPAQHNILGGCRTNFHGRSCSLIFRSRVGSLVSKKIPSPRFSPGSCPKAPASPPVLSVNAYQKPPVLFPNAPGFPPVLSGAPGSPPVPPRFSPGSPHTLRQP